MSIMGLQKDGSPLVTWVVILVTVAWDTDLNNEATTTIVWNYAKRSQKG
jgi:hypothetical protein